MDPSTIRALCEHYGALSHIRVIADAVYVRYETATYAQSAYVSLNGQKIFNTQIIAEVSTESECLKAIEAAAASMHNTAATALPITNQVNPVNPGFNGVTSYGGLWTTSNGNAPPQPTPQQYIPQSYTNNPQSFASNPPSFTSNPQNFASNPQTFASNPQQSFSTNLYGPPTTIGVNGFNHWAVPNTQTVIPGGNQLWGPAPTQPQATSVYQAYPGWMPTKQEVPLQASIFSPGMDRCLPGELFNTTKETNS